MTGALFTKLMDRAPESVRTSRGPMAYVQGEGVYLKQRIGVPPLLRNVYRAGNAEVVRVFLQGCVVRQFLT